MCDLFKDLGDVEWQLATQMGFRTNATRRGSSGFTILEEFFVVVKERILTNCDEEAMEVRRASRALFETFFNLSIVLVGLFAGANLRTPVGQVSVFGLSVLLSVNAKMRYDNTVVFVVETHEWDVVVPGDLAFSLWCYLRRLKKRFAEVEPNRLVRLAVHRRVAK